jgi:hypothetical protein
MIHLSGSTANELLNNDGLFFVIVPRISCDCYGSNLKELSEFYSLNKNVCIIGGGFDESDFKKWHKFNGYNMPLFLSKDEYPFNINVLVIGYCNYRTNKVTMYQLASHKISFFDFIEELKKNGEIS